MFRFECDITVEGVQYKTGDTVKKTELPGGCVVALLNQRRIVEIKESNPQNQPAKKA